MMTLMALETNLKGDLGGEGIASIVWATITMGNDSNAGKRNKPERRPRWRWDCLNSVGNGDNWSFLFLLLSHVNHVVGDCSRSLPE